MPLKKTLTAPLLALLLAALTLGNAVAEERGSKHFDVSGFTRIELKGSSHLQVVQGEAFEVVASGPAEAIPYARAEVDGDTLELSVEADKKRWFGMVTVSSAPDIKYRVTLPGIESLKVTGSGEATAATLESEGLELKVTGSGVIRVERVAAENLSASVTGSGDLLVGTALVVEAQASITGSGDLALKSLAGERFDANIKGSGDMLVGGRVSELQVTLMGSGDFAGRSLEADSAGGSIMGSGDIVIRRPGRDSFSVMGSGDVALVD